MAGGAGRLGKDVVVGGRYRILEKLAEGGMGAVYKVEHLLSHKKLALKVLHAHMQHGRNAVERFKREVSAAAEIDHPGIVQIFDAGVDTDGTFYMAMELLEGESLGSRTRRQWPGTRTSVDLIIGMCEPLAKAHQKGFVHRDLKPENVFVVRDEEGRERTKILDLGLVREVARRGPTMSGVTFGTPEYMAPEQAMSAKRAEMEADVWSLGAMLYELLAGRHPFTGETANAVMANAIKDPLPPLAEVAPHVPAALASVVEHCLEKDPRDRIRNAGALGAALRAVREAHALDERGPVVVTRVGGSVEEDSGPHAKIDLPTLAPLPSILLRDQGRARGLSRRARRQLGSLLGVVGVAAVVVLVALAVERSSAPMVATALPGRTSPAEEGPAPVAGAVDSEAPAEFVPPDPGTLGEAPGRPLAGPGARGASVQAAALEVPSRTPEEAAMGAAVEAGPIVPAAGASPTAAGSFAEGPAPSREPVAARGRVGGVSGPAPAGRAEEASGGADGASTGLAAARVCMQRADLRCAVAALADSRGAPEIEMLVELYQAQGRAVEAQAAMQRYVRRHPRGAQVEAYRRALGLLSD